MLDQEREEENQNLNQELETDKLREMTLIKTAKFSVIREETKFLFTISQKNTSLVKITRNLKCKTANCPKKGEIILIGKSEDQCELWLNQYPHEKVCEEQSDLFKTQKLRKLIQTNLKPNEIIKQFNKDSDRKLPNNEETRKKISKLKYLEKSKAEINHEINNLKDLGSWLYTKYQHDISDGSFDSLNWNQPFVADFEIYEDNFFSFATTKNLIYNFIKQEQTNFNRLCADGTYKLNNLGYPLIVLGTIDLHRKFHLSNF